MKYLRQFLIILGVSALGEILNNFIPLPIPGSIYGIVLMLIFLYFKIIKLEQVKDTAEFLITIMPVTFIPAAVGLITVWDQSQKMLLPVLVAIGATTILVMGVTGRVADLFIRQEDKHESK